MIRKVVVIIVSVMPVTANTGNVCAQDRYWLSPSSINGLTSVWTMFEQPEAWDSVLCMTDVISLHVNALDGATISEIETAIAVVHSYGLKVNFECGGMRPFSGCDADAPRRHALGELNLLSRWYFAGGPIDHIAMDSPVNTTIAGGDPSQTCNWTVAQAAQGMVLYMQTVREYLPDVQFSLVEPVPWYSVDSFPSFPPHHYGNLITTLDTVWQVLNSAGLSLAFFHADHPYEYVVHAPFDGWGKLVYLESYIHNAGQKLGMIFNSQLGGFQSDSVFYTETLACYDAYLDAGGNPDAIEVWTWYAYPEVLIPESQPWSLTYTALELFKKAGATCDHGTGTHHTGSSGKWIVYPNPAHDLLTIYGSGPFDYQVANIAGQVLFGGEGIDTRTIHLKGLPTGMYLCRVWCKEEGGVFLVMKE